MREEGDDGSLVACGAQALERFDALFRWSGCLWVWSELSAASRVQIHHDQRRPRSGIPLGDGHQCVHRGGGLEFDADLPRTPTGKLVKGELKRLYG